MLEYKTIDYYGKYWGLPIVAFDKLDGSNLRFECSQKRGFYKFGTKQMMIDENHQEFGFALKIFKDKYEKDLLKIFKTKAYRNTRSFICYAELEGKESQFGQHNFNSDIFDVILFDIEQHKTGLISPKQFIKDFQHLGIPDIIYEGNLNKEFVNDVKNNRFGLREGVVCKGVIPNKKNDNLYYCKIKTTDWFERLRTKSIDLYNEEMKQMSL